MLLALGPASLRPGRCFTPHTRAQPAARLATIMANSSSDDEEGGCFTRSVMRTGRRKAVLLDSPASDAENRTPASARQPLRTTPTLQHTSVQGVSTQVHGSRPSPQAVTTKLHSPAAEQRTPCTPRDQASTRPLDLHDPFTPWLRTGSKLPPSAAHQKRGGATATPAAMQGSSLQSSPPLWSPLSVSTGSTAGAGAATTSPASVGMLRPGRAEAAAGSPPASAVTPGEATDRPAAAAMPPAATTEHSGSLLPTWSPGAAVDDDAHTMHAGAACSPASTCFEDAGSPPAGSPLSQLTGPGAAASPAAAPLLGPGDVSPISISSFGGQSSSMMADCEEVSSRSTSSAAPGQVGPAATPSPPPAAACDSLAASSYATATDAAASPAGDATDDASSSWAGEASSAGQPPPPSPAPAEAAHEVQPEAEDAPAAGTPVVGGVLAATDGSQQQQQQESATLSRTPPPAAAARAAAAAHDSSDDEDEGTLLTFTRRRPTGLLRRRPPAAWASASSSSSDEASDTSSSSSSDEDGGSDEDREYVASSRSSGGGSRQGCGHTGCSSSSRPRVTPGSSSSLVARRRGRRLQGLHQQHPQQPQRSTTTAGAGYSGAYDFDLHVSSVSRPGADSSQQQQGADSLALMPVAALSFTPAAAAGGAAFGSSAAGSAARRLSGCFAGAAPPLISPPMLKLQERLQGLQLQPQPRQEQRTPAAKPPPAPPAAAKGRKPAAAAAGAMTAPAKAPSSRTFARQRQQLSQQLYAQWNAQVFDCSLPPDLALVWNPRLTATAGQVVDDGSRNAAKASRDERIPVRLELSSKVLDCEARLRSTLAHEMCHVAAWAVSREFKQHHGPAFWAWARRFEGRVPDIKVTTCHSYDVHAPFRWMCSNYSCGKQYHRHKRSIDTVKHVCSRCSARLVYLGKFSRDGRLIGASSSTGTPGAAVAGGTGNVFSRFVKAHFADVKRGLPAGTPHKEVMSCLAARYKQQKAAATPVAAAAVADDADAASASSGQDEPDGGLLSFMDRLALS